MLDDNISGTVNAGENQSSAEPLRQAIERLLRAGIVVAKIDGTTHQIFPVGITRAEGQALRSWVIRENARCTIEIGLAYGISALFICEGFLVNGKKDMRHVVVDPYQSTGFKKCGLQSLEEAGVPRSFRDFVDF